jgi:hypothetical protein
MSASGDAPGRVANEGGDTLDDVPVPSEGQGAENVQVVADERLPVEDDREEVNRQVVLGDAWFLEPRVSDPELRAESGDRFQAPPDHVAIVREPLAGPPLASAGC